MTGGRVSATGVGGLTLGSGSGWLERAFGLTADNLLAVTVVCADGRIVRASADEHADLFFALAAAAGTSASSPSSSTACTRSARSSWAGWWSTRSSAPRRLRQYRDLMDAAPDAVVRRRRAAARAAGAVRPGRLVGHPSSRSSSCTRGRWRRDEAGLAPLRGIGEPIADVVGPMPYTAVQQLLDPAYPWRLRAYFKAAFMDALSDEAIHDLVSPPTSRPR